MRAAILAVALTCAIAEAVSAQSQSPIRGGVVTLPAPVFAACPPDVECEPPAQEEVPAGGRSAFGFFRQATAALSFVEAAGLEVAATAMSLEIAGPIRTTQVGDGSTVQVDTSFISLRLLNRAALTLDSLHSLANDYLTSLQAAPITIRGEYPLQLTAVGIPAPLVLRADGRGVPYADSANSLTIGAAAQISVGTALSRYARSRDENGDVVDDGVIYFEPTVYAVFGEQNLMETVRESGDGFAGIEARVGYRSSKGSGLDFGLLGRCAFVELIGPTCRLTLSGGTNR